MKEAGVTGWSWLRLKFEGTNNAKIKKYGGVIPPRWDENEQGTWGAGRDPAR